MTADDMTFTVSVYEAEEGGYWAEVLELPGCASQGDTLDELQNNIQEAIIACMQAHFDDEGSHTSRRVATWTLPMREPMQKCAAQLLPA